MSPFLYYDAVQRLQQAFDVSRLTLDGVNYWMAVRLLMLGRFSGEANRRAVEIFGRPAHRSVLFSDAVEVRRDERPLPPPRVFEGSALVFASPDRRTRRADVIFYEGPVDYSVVVDGVAVNRIADGFVEAFEGSVLKVCRFSPRIVRSAKRHDPAFVHVAPQQVDLSTLEAIRFREAVGDLCALAHEICPTFAMSQADLLQNVREIYSAARAHEAWIRGSGAQLLLFQSFISFEKMAVMLGARRAGVRTVDVQHGYSDAHSIYNGLPLLPEGQRALYPDVMWCWGEATARAMRRDGTLAANGVEVRVGGDVWGAVQAGSVPEQATRLRAALNADSHSKRILVGQQIETLSHSAALRGYLPTPLYDAMVQGPRDWLWMLRVHPRSLHLVGPIRAFLQAEGLTNVEVEHSSTSSIEAILALADVYLTSFSVSAFEAHANGVPVVIFDQVGQELFAAEIGAGAFVHADTTASILAAIDGATKVTVKLDYYRRDLHTSRKAMKTLLLDAGRQASAGLGPLTSRDARLTQTIGVLGLGRMGERIVSAARELGIDVSAVYDRSPDAFAIQNDASLAEVYTSDLAAFWASKPDVVAIATHGPSHCPLLLEGLRHGVRRFLVEKPLGTSVEEARAAEAEARALGARVIVNHGRRYCDVYDQLKTLDGSPEMGRLASAVLTLGAAGLGCMGTHFFDLFNRVFGAPVSLYATVTTPSVVNPRGAEFDDPGGTALITYEGGRRVLVDMGDDVGVPGRMEFVYERGRVIIEDELKPWRVLARGESDRAAPVTRYGLPLTEATLTDFTPCGIMYATSRAIADAFAETPPASDMQVGLAALEVFAAIRWSAATGESVRWPLPQAAIAAVYPIS
jgi:predicted dehydrogenase